MKLRALALPFVLALACSSRDQSLGETRHTQPVIDPTPTPVPNPTPNPDPNPDPNPNPNPTPITTPACEDKSLHPRVGKCSAFCLGVGITAPGYECPPGQCCDDPPTGCNPFDPLCPDYIGNQGGQGGEGGAAGAGSGGAP